MTNKLQTGLLVFVAALLCVNTYLLTSGDSVSATPVNRPQVAATKAANQTPERTNTPQLAAETTSAPAGPTTKITFDKSEHDFGTINQDSENKHLFTFTNTGNEPLIIENAKGSCGCTVPNYPKEPIPPGGTGEIEVVYKPGKQKAAQNKSITITANTEPKNTILTIRANVLEQQG